MFSRIIPFLVGPEKYLPRPIKYQTMAPPGVSRVPPNRKNCEREGMACTMNAIPSSDALCQKSKLPFGLILHPYKDLQTLPGTHIYICLILTLL